MSFAGKMIKTTVNTKNAARSIAIKRIWGKSEVICLTGGLI
jgi:hypothetical protein